MSLSASTIELSAAVAKLCMLWDVTPVRAALLILAPLKNSGLLNDLTSEPRGSPMILEAPYVEKAAIDASGITLYGSLFPPSTSPPAVTPAALTPCDTSLAFLAERAS